MCARVARIAHIQARTGRDRPIWSPTFSISRMWVTRSPFETQSDQMATCCGRTRRHRPMTVHFRATSSLDNRALEPVHPPTDQSQEPDIEKHSDQIGLRDTG